MAVLLALNDVPLHDEATKFSARWNERLWQSLGDIARIDLYDEDAVRSKWEKAVDERNPDLIVHYGHGSDWTLVGDDLKAIMDEYNAKKAAGRTVYTMCCNAASKLGADAYRKGCVAWWGYVRPFSFTTDDEEIFCELANLGLIVRNVTGISWPKVLERVKEAYEDKVEEIREVGGDPWTIIALVGNKNALVVWTDETPPTSDCAFRNLGVRMFGKAGHHLSKSSVFFLTMLGVGYGIALHDYVHQVWQLKGTWMSLEGGYVGFGIMLLFGLLLVDDYLKWLGKRR